MNNITSQKKPVNLKVKNRLEIEKKQKEKLKIDIMTNINSQKFEFWQLIPTRS